MKFVHEAFIRFSQLDSMKDVLCPREPGGIACGVFVLTPYIFAFLCTNTTFLLFDTHAHGDHGALFTEVPVEYTGKYLRLFFRTHYNHMNYHDASAKNLAAHLTVLSRSVAV